MLPKNIKRLIDEFAKLPSIGPKMSSRIVFYLLKHKGKLNSLGQAVEALQGETKLCPQCFNYTEDGLCVVCADDTRQNWVVCVVETVLDLVAIESSQEYKGGYHILGGVLSPINGVGPNDIRINELIERVKLGQVKELIFAFNPNLEGESTAMYIFKSLNEVGITPNEEGQVKVTKLALWIPLGSSLEFNDSNTLGRSLQGRVEF